MSTQDGTAQWAHSVVGLHEDIVDNIAGVVVVHRDLFENDFTLTLDIRCIESAVEDHVADGLDRQVGVIVKDTGIKAGVLLAREGIHLTTHGLHRCGDLPCRTRARAFEEQMLEEVRRPRLPRCFVT